MTSRGFIPREPMALLFLGFTSVLAAGAGIWSGQPLVLLALCTLPPFLIFFSRMQQKRRGSAFGLMVAWAFLHSLVMITLIQLMPEKSATAILRGVAYRDEMFHWIQTGVGAEGDWKLFVPQHATHYGAFLVLSALTAGAAGLALGAVLLNYMNFYVASLFLADTAGDHTLMLSLMGWPVWSMIRVVGFIAGAVAMTDMTLAAIARLKDRPGRWPGQSSYYLSLSLSLVILDALLKALLAPTWRNMLSQVFGPGL